MKILQASGGLQPVVLDANSLAILVITAERMLKGGVVFSADDWLGMSECEREALVIARSRVDAAHLVMLATALSGPRGAGAVASVIDGGALDQAISKELEKLREQEVLIGDKVQSALGA